MTSIGPPPSKYSALPGGVDKHVFLGRLDVPQYPCRDLRVSVAAFVSSSGAVVGMLGSSVPGGGMSFSPPAESTLPNSTTSEEMSPDRMNLKAVDLLCTLIGVPLCPDQAL